MYDYTTGTLILFLSRIILIKYNKGWRNLPAFTDDVLLAQLRTII